MKKLKNVLIMMALVLACVFVSKNNVSAKTKSVNPLKANKTYKYNLDKKGKAEEVKIVKKEDPDEFEKYTTVYINKKAVLSKVREAAVFVLDTNTKDKQMEIIVIKDFDNDTSYGGGADLSNAVYYRYTGGKLKKIQALKPVIKKKYTSGYAFIHYVTNKTVFKVDSKGNLTYRMCISLKKGLDYIHFSDTLVLKKGKFVTSKKKSISLRDETKEPYYSKGTNKVYTKPGSSKVAFTIPDNTAFYRKSVYIKDKKTYYIKIKVKKTGKTGYIKNNSFKARDDGMWKHA